MIDRPLTPSQVACLCLYVDLMFKIGVRFKKPEQCAWVAS